MALIEASLNQTHQEIQLDRIKRRLDLGAKVNELAGTICTLTTFYYDAIAELVKVITEIDDAWQYHCRVHQPNPGSVRCDDCDLYDPDVFYPSAVSPEEISG